MGAKELTRADFKDVESVVPSPEDRLYLYLFLILFNNFDDIKSEVYAEVTDAASVRLLDLLKENGNDIEKVRQIISAKVKQEPTKEEQGGWENLQGAAKLAESKARLFLSNREERLRTTFCKEYLAPMVLAGMRGGWLINTWWRAVCYGFSVSPSTYDEVEDKSLSEYQAFPYRSLDEMTEEDRRAFLWAVEDTYHEVEGLGYTWQLRVSAPDEQTERMLLEKLHSGRYFEPYPKEGYKAEEVARRHLVTEEDVYDSWEYDLELFLPIVINRQDEAIYYATKYKGSEYLDYIRSLNVEEDYNYAIRGAEEYEEGEKPVLYNEVMEEGYVWHSDK